jgi:membrane-associated phospholipid phosphatase
VSYRRVVSVLSVAAALSIPAMVRAGDVADVAPGVGAGILDHSSIGNPDGSPASSLLKIPTWNDDDAGPLALEPELGGDGRRTLGRFVPNLGRNFIGVFSRQNVKPLLLGAALTGAGSLLDQQARGYVIKSDSLPALGSAGQTAGGSTVIVPLSALLFTAGRFSHDGRLRAATYDALQATIVTGAYTFGLKTAVSRTRPDGSNDLSFPSGHTSNAFAWAAIASHYYGKRAGIAAYGAAGLIGFSRIQQDKHYLSDVLAGATLGYIVGRTVVHKDGEPVRSHRQVLVSPATDARGSGVGLQLSVLF